MGWGLGYDTVRHRWIGYAVPAYCDHPGCLEEIDRGLAYVCGGEPYGGDHGCGMFFCYEHFVYTENKQGEDSPQLCQACVKMFETNGDSWDEEFPGAPEHPEWLSHLLTDESWEEWRQENPDTVRAHTLELLIGVVN